MTPLSNCPRCGSNDLHTDHTGLSPGHQEDLQQWCNEPECDWSLREQDNSDDDNTTPDLTHLSESDLALHTSLAGILSGETAILDPDDADNLALVIVNEMPPVYNAAPELLEVLARCADFMGSVANSRRGPSKVSDSFRQAYKDARSVIAKATGEPVSA